MPISKFMDHQEIICQYLGVLYLWFPTYPWLYNHRINYLTIWIMKTKEIRDVVSNLYGWIPVCLHKITNSKHLSLACILLNLWSPDSVTLMRIDINTGICGTCFINDSVYDPLHQVPNFFDKYASAGPIHGILVISIYWTVQCR